MNYQEVLLAVYILSILLGAFLFRPKKQLAVQSTAKNTPFYSHDDLMKALDRRILDELADVQQEYSLRGIPMVYDFKQETINIAGRIFTSLSPNMISQLEQFYTREYVMIYIGRNVKTYLIEYTRKHKIKTK